MEQLPNGLDAVVFAAGMATVYNDGDWDGFVDKRPRLSFEDELFQAPELPH